MDSFLKWLDALDARHRRELSFQEVRRGVQALSSLYVERRTRIREGAAFEGAGKRAAFATFFSPLHFLLIREVVRGLGGSPPGVSSLLDLGCGSGAAGAAWATDSERPPRLLGVDRNTWAVQEARWTYGVFGLNAVTKTADINTVKLPERTAVVAAFVLNELSEEGRGRWRQVLLGAARQGAPVLVVEPIAKKLSPWWDEWAEEFVAAGGRSEEWRFEANLPERLALMDKAAGLDHRELTGRSLSLGFATNQTPPT